MVIDAIYTSFLNQMLQTSFPGVYFTPKEREQFLAKFKESSTVEYDGENFVLKAI